MNDSDHVVAMETVTRPIIGIENRTAQEVFDIMCDRFKASASRLAKQGPAWQTTEPPKDGTPVYIRTVQPYRYLPYKPTSQQYKRGEKGRWQVMNEYGGWENSHPLGNEWQIDSPFSSPSPVGGAVS